MESNLNVEVGAFQLQGDFTRLQQRLARQAQTHRRETVVEKEKRGNGRWREEE